MYFFPLASKTPPFPLLCTLYNSRMTLSGDLVGWALCAACEKRLPKITSRGINEQLIVLIVSAPQKFAILRKPYNAALQLPAHSTYIRDIVAARQLQALVTWPGRLCLRNSRLMVSASPRLSTISNPNL